MQPLGRLADEIERLARDLEVALCEWLGLLAEFDRREGWAAEGARSCSEWVAWKCGLSPAAARDRVRVARRLEELPLVRTAFARGELTYSKVRALTRVENAEHEVDIIGLARSATAGQLERIVGGYRRVERVEAGVAAQIAERFLELHVDEDGTMVLRGRLPADDGAALLAAIEQRRDEQALVADGGELDRVGARNADALVALVEAGVAAPAAGRTGGERCQIVVHVDAETLGGSEAGRCELECGAPLAGEAVRRLACDASLVRIVERDGRPLSIGRKTRSIPPALRRALRSRDRGCQFPCCTATRHTDAHHIEHWADGGPTDLDNLVMLCRYHHRLLHEGGFVVERSTHSLVFTAPDGRKLPRVPRRRDRCAPLPRASAAAPNQPRYDPLHLGYAVDAMLDFAPIRPRAALEFPQVPAVRDVPGTRTPHGARSAASIEETEG
jgi:hypothetical protein